jgi:hypothetical protein
MNLDTQILVDHHIDMSIFVIVKYMIYLTQNMMKLQSLIVKYVDDEYYQ